LEEFHVEEIVGGEARGGEAGALLKGKFRDSRNMLQKFIPFPLFHL